jgi:hypothetical protein
MSYGLIELSIGRADIKISVQPESAAILRNFVPAFAIIL